MSRPRHPKTAADVEVIRPGSPGEPTALSIATDLPIGPAIRSLAQLLGRQAARDALASFTHPTDSTGCCDDQGS